MLNAVSRLIVSHAPSSLRRCTSARQVGLVKRPVSQPKALKSSRFALLPANTKQLFSNKRLFGVRFISKAALSWDGFRKDSLALAEKIGKLLADSNGHLERGMAELLAKEAINLDQRNPSRQSTVFSTHLFEHDFRTRAASKATESGDRDSEVDHYEVLLVLAHEARDAKLSMQIFSEILQKDLDITPVMVNSLMMTHLRELEPHRALAIFSKADSIEAVQSANPEDCVASPVDAVTLCCAIEMYKSLGDVHNMSKIYGRLSKLAASTELRMDVVQQGVSDYICGLVEIGQPTLAIQVYENIAEVGDKKLLQGDRVSRAMLEAFSDLKQHRKVVQLFDRLMESGERVSYAVVLRVIVSRLVLNQTAKAKEMYARLEAEFGPGQNMPHSFEALSRMASSSSGFPAARPNCEDRSILGTLQEHGSTSTNVEKAIAQFALGGDLVTAEKLLNDWMYETDTATTTSAASFSSGSSSNLRLPTPAMVTALINGAVRLNNGHFLELVEKHDIKISTSLTRAIVQFHLKKNDPTRAAAALEAALAKNPTLVGERVLVEVLSSFAMSHSSTHIAGLNYYKAVVKALPDGLPIEFFNAALGLFTKMMNGEMLTSVLQEMKDRSIESNVATYTAIMKIYLRKPDYKTVIATYTQILQKGLIPDADAVLTLATALGESKALAHAKSVKFLQDQLLYSGVEPTPTVIEILQRATRLSQNPAAFAVLVEALKEHFTLHLTADQYLDWLAALLEFDDLPGAIELAISLAELARRNPDLLTRAFCCRLALHISDQVGTDFPVDTLDKWIVDPSVGAFTLEMNELLQFQKALQTWASFYPKRR